MLKKFCFIASLVLCFGMLAGCNNINANNNNNNNNNANNNANNNFDNIYNAVLYDNAVDIIDETFARNNLIGGVYYEDIPDADTLFPSSRYFIVKDETGFNEIFKADSLNVNFEIQMVIVFTDSIEYRHPAEIRNMSLNGKSLEVTYGVKLIRNAGSACQPYQRWFVIKMDNLDISSAEFLRDDFYGD